MFCFRKFFYLFFVCKIALASTLNVELIKDDTSLNFAITPKKNFKAYTDKIFIQIDGKKITPSTNYKKETFTEMTRFSIPKQNYKKLSVIGQSCSLAGICYAPEAITISKSIINIIILSLIFGIMASFSPCYLPLIPVLASQINANKYKKNGYFFILGTLAANASIGLAINIIGINLSNFFNLVPIKASFAIFLIYMAFVAISWLQLPRMDLKINKKISPTGTILLGFISVFILSPCTSAPLAASINLAIKEAQPIIIMLAFGIGATTSLMLFMHGFWKIVPKTWSKYTPYLISIVLVYLAFDMLISSTKIPESFNYYITGLFAICLCFRKLDKLQKILIPSFAGLIIASYFMNTEPKNLKLQTIEENTLYFVTANWCGECKKIKSELLTKNNLSKIKAITKFKYFDVTQPGLISQLEKYKIYGPPAWLKISDPTKYSVAYGTISLEKLIKIANFK